MRGRVSKRFGAACWYHFSFVLAVSDVICIASFRSGLEEPRQGSDGLGVRNLNKHTQSLTPPMDRRIGQLASAGATPPTGNECRCTWAALKWLGLGVLRRPPFCFKKHSRHDNLELHHNIATSSIHKMSLSRSKLYILYAKMGMLRPYCE